METHNQNEELRKKLDSELSRYLSSEIYYGFENLLSFFQSEIERAEKAKVEEVIEEVDGTHKALANELRLKFLTEPQQ